MTWQQIEPAYRLGHELGNVREAFTRARRGRTMVQHA